MSLAKKANKRSEAVKFYLSEGEARMLKRQAKDFGLSVPDYVRMLIRQEGCLVGRAHGFKREQDLP
jgi:16S rRNA U516 pseudouridylate synthase RsuA-like enzyme